MYTVMIFVAFRLFDTSYNSSEKLLRRFFETIVFILFSSCTVQAICASLRHSRPLPPAVAVKTQTARGNGATTGSGAFTVTRQRLQAQKWEQLVAALLAQTEWGALKKLARNRGRALDRASAAAAATPSSKASVVTESHPEPFLEISSNSPASNSFSGGDKSPALHLNDDGSSSRSDSTQKYSLPSSIYSRPGAAWAVKLLRSTRARRLQAAAAARKLGSGGNLVLVRSPPWVTNSASRTYNSVKDDSNRSESPQQLSFVAAAKSAPANAAANANPASAATGADLANATTNADPASATADADPANHDADLASQMGVYAVACPGCHSKVLLPSLAAHQR